MPPIVPQRMTAELEGDFVVFLIGMRINRPWKLHKWLPVVLAMPRMLRELEARPESGFLGAPGGDSREKGANSRRRASRGTPGPLSETAIRSSQAPCLARPRTAPRALVLT